jgi:RimJ/RimL family protein N-acetyltransferase
MTAERPSYGRLEGRFVSVSPLTPDQIPELFTAIGHPEVFAGGYGGGPAGYRDNLGEFTEFAEKYYHWDSGNVYGIRLRGGASDGVLVGTSTLGEFNFRAESGHLGWTAYDPRVWGTAVNPEAKLLILGHAFRSGLGRVKIQADELNDRSRAAIAKLGATFEGITRRDAQRSDGSWRNAAVFSVIVDDWERVRSGLEERVDGYGDTPVKLHSR